MMKRLSRIAVATLPFLLLAACATPPEETATSTKVRITLVGDSTQTEKQGYGIGFCANLTAQVDCVNKAKGGASTMTYRRDGLWGPAQTPKPDWMLIQFGHNDVPTASHGDRETTLEEYTANLRRYVTEARAAGIKPILVTSIARRYYQPDGKIRDDLTEHVALMKKVAAEMNVPLLDLHTLSQDYMEKIGEVAGHKLGATKIDKSTGATIPDKTHFNLAGSYVFGRMVAEGMARTVPELAQYVKPVPATMPQ